MFSGSAVVDWKNTSGFGKDGVPPLVLIYTAAGNPTVQCLAYSTDKGTTWTKYKHNPVLVQITPGNRDPKVIWHEPTQKWVMVLYVAQPKPGGGEIHTIEFQTSPNLKDWTYASKIEGFFECPDFFELPVDGDPEKKKWVLTAASSEYMLGTFDGQKFTPETPKLTGHRGRGYYAPQTFSDIPAKDGRRIQIGWLQAPSPGMSFNQAMSLPAELTLRTTPDGIRMARTPVQELNTLASRPSNHGGKRSTETPNPFSQFRAEHFVLQADFQPGDATNIEFKVRGVPIRYDVKKQELAVADVRVPAPLQQGKQRLQVYVDRTALEIFASDGLTYIPLPLIPKADELGVSVKVEGGTADYSTLSVAKMHSIWPGSTTP